MTRARLAHLLTALVVLTMPSLARGQAREPFSLEIGDPARKSRTMTLAVDQIHDTNRGVDVSPDEVAAALADASIVLIGESHTSAESHRVQAAVIAALQRAGRKVTIGLEMFPSRSPHGPLRSLAARRHRRGGAAARVGLVRLLGLSLGLLPRRVPARQAVPHADPRRERAARRRLDGRTTGPVGHRWHGARTDRADHRHDQRGAQASVRGVRGRRQRDPRRGIATRRACSAWSRRRPRGTRRWRSTPRS